MDGRDFRDRMSEADAERESADAPRRIPEGTEHLAAAVGNRAFSAFAEGGGILPGNRVHPDIEATIARTRGGGARLAPDVNERFSSSLGTTLEDVRIHTGGYADALARSVSARAFTTGSDVYFGAGEYRPRTPEGDRLLSHELTHVLQQRGTAPGGPMVVSQPGDALELEAEAASP